MTEPTLSYAIAQRDACQAYLDGEGPEHIGAWMGWRDWTVEIMLLTALQQSPAPSAIPPHHSLPAIQPTSSP